ncbi:MAG: helix-turn-helix transcriptional regulator [Gammaproteobacteria bacterium]|nr:helix-turn-helix transcriptional regulator [Gammaproteobacteria bacterium]
MAKNTLKIYLKRIKRVLSFIETHLDEERSLEELAKIACFSSYHFHRIFTGMVGESVKSYIRRLRLERAARQLLSSSSKLSVTEIAFSAGYQTSESFSKAFFAAYTSLRPKIFALANLRLVLTDKC